jgi:hypothetical protein
MLPEALGVDPHRRVVDGTAHWVGTSQKMRFMFTRERTVQGKVDAVTAGASAGASQATHIAYDVHLTRYLELPPDSLRYSAASSCCLEGQVTSSCGEWYVIRMMWGTGRVQYLQQVSANASISAGQLLRAEGGTAYRRLNEIAFDDAFFAYEAVPLADLCASVQPEDELSAMYVRAPRNCWVMAQRNDGTHATMTWHLGNEQGCRDVASSYCAKQSGILSCHMTYSSGDQTTSLAIPLDELPRTIEVTPLPESVAATKESETPAAPAKSTAPTKAAASTPATGTTPAKAPGAAPPTAKSTAAPAAARARASAPAAAATAGAGKPSAAVPANVTNGAATVPSR